MSDPVDVLEWPAFYEARIEQAIPKQQEPVGWAHGMNSPKFVVLFRCNECLGHGFIDADTLAEAQHWRKYIRPHSYGVATENRPDGTKRVEGFSKCGEYEFADIYIKVDI